MRSGKERGVGPVRPYKIVRGSVSSTCCKALLWWETLAHTRMVRKVDGVPSYLAMCPRCKRKIVVPAASIRRSEAAALRRKQCSWTTIADGLLPT